MIEPGACVSAELKRRSAGRLCALWIGVYFISGCATMISDQREIALGEQYREELAKQLEIDDDRYNLNYINLLGLRLLNSAPRRPAISYTFDIVKDDALNAFAIPGGHIYINTGTIKVCADESELAAVLAHEIGHVVGLHHKQTMARSVGVGVVNSIVFGNRAEDARMLAELVEKGILLKYGRSQEYQADDIGLSIVYGAGFEPSGLLRFFEKLQAEGGKEPGKVQEFFSTHPLTGSRIERARRTIGAMPMNAGAQRDSPEFRAMRARVAAGG